MSTETKFCSRCGSPLSPEDRFCSHCGAPVPSSQPSEAAAPSPSAEPIVDVIPVQQRSGFMGMTVKSFNMILTPQRLILLPITKEEMNEAVKTARERARAAGKGLFGQWHKWPGCRCSTRGIGLHRWKTWPGPPVAL